MTPEQFCYWLRGYAELSTTRPDAEQWGKVMDTLYKVLPPHKPWPIVVDPSGKMPAFPATPSRYGDFGVKVELK